MTPWLIDPFDVLSYAADISELVGNEVARACPSCSTELRPVSQWVPESDAEGDVLCWRLTHKCGAHLTVFND